MQFAMNEPVQPNAGYEGMSAAKLLRALGGDRDLLLEIIELFQRDAPAMLAGVRKYADFSDRDALAKAAHMLKGSTANFGKSPLYEVTRDIEICAYDGDAARLPELLERFEAAAEGFLQALVQLKREVNT